MIRDDIIRMAREAGVEMYPSPTNDVRLCTLKNLERFANLIAAAEREACAMFIEQDYVRQFDEPWRDNLAKAIRARGAL